MTETRKKITVAMMLLFAPATRALADSAADGVPAISGSVTGYYYAMRDQSDFGVGVASLNRDTLHVEARYNYEAMHSASIFAGWNFSAGETLTFAVTPLIGVLFGDVRGVIPGLEASVAYGDVDGYIEAEYVHDLRNRSDSYFYAWSEVGWKPAHWLRIGLVGQRSQDVNNGRDFQRGAFVQLMFGKVTLGFYGFNPDSGSRYGIFSLGAQF